MTVFSGPDKFYVLDRSEVRDLSDAVLDESGRPKVLPASFYQSTTREERGMLGVQHGLYCLPTLELVDWLVAHIGRRRAIEIGAGNGRLAEAVGIRATDNFQQTNPMVRAHYEALGQPTIRYGPNVERLDAQEAVNRYEPEVVVGSWITHRFDPRVPERGGNMYGPDADWLVERCEYVMIGNIGVHGQHPLLSRSHDVVFPPWLYSRAMNGSLDFIATWRP